MKYLQASIDLGFPADCASNGNTYEDLVRTWNKSYTTLPKLNALQARIDEVAAQLANGKFESIADNSLIKRPEVKKPKRFFGLF